MVLLLTISLHGSAIKSKVNANDARIIMKMCDDNILCNSSKALEEEGKSGIERNRMGVNSV